MLSIYQWQVSHIETNWFYFFLNYSSIRLLWREWHSFYDFLSFGISSCIRQNETILYHSAVVITPNFDICLVLGSVLPGSHLDPNFDARVSTCVSMCVSLYAITFGHLFLADRNPSICLRTSFSFLLTHFMWLYSLRNTTTALKIRRGVYL